VPTPRTPAESHLLKSELDRSPLVVARGEGCYLWDQDGRRYLDGASGAVAAALGHAHPRLVQALSDQAARVSHVYRGSFTSQPVERLAAMLTERAPAGLNQALFANSGSEAVESALKVAVQYWQEMGRPDKWQALSRRHSYHGNTLGALSLSGHRSRRTRYEKLIHPFAVVAAPSSTDPSSVEDFERMILQRGPEAVAAVVIEPVVGAAAPALVPPPGYYERLREICDQHDVLLIADEVMTGIYRTGTFLAMEHWGVKPDIVVLGKGLGGGCVPLSAVLLSDRVVDGFAKGSRKLDSGGHTYATNPLAAAVGVAVLETVDAEGVAENCTRVGAELGEGLEKLRAAHPVITAARGKGLLWGFELDTDLVPHAGRALVDAALDHGLVIYLGGDGEIDGVLITPPLILTSEQVTELIEKLDTALTTLEMSA
jgi:adenosylmethionine-8-amino-7-oxononanoate aminotransferase